MSYDKNQTVVIEIVKKISFERIGDLLCCAWEGGSNYWAEATVSQEEVKQHGVEFDWEIPLTPTGSIDIYDKENPEAERLGFISKQRVVQALQMMARGEDEKGNKIHMGHWNNFMKENEDAETGDVFFQLAVLGEIVYG
jgi:hypothetical protein